MAMPDSEYSWMNAVPPEALKECSPEELARVHGVVCKLKQCSARTLQK